MAYPPSEGARPSGRGMERGQNSQRSCTGHVSGGGVHTNLDHTWERGNVVLKTCITDSERGRIDRAPRKNKTNEMRAKMRKG